MNRFTKETNESHNTFKQSATHYKEREKAFIKILSVVYFILSLL